MKKFGKGHVLSHQTLLTMKLTIVLMTIALLQVKAGAFSQKVTVIGRNLTLKEVFDTIEKQTGYSFFYGHDLLNNAKNVTLHVKDEKVNDVLALCFEGQPLAYDIEKKTVFISAQPVTPERADAPPPADDQKADSLISIRGKVVNENGEPLAGVSIKVKGALRGTTTDISGIFSLRVPPHTTLVITSVGYVSREIVAESEAPLAIHMVRSNKAIDDVVVTGLGESRIKRSLGYSVTQISGDQIREANAVNPIVALQGMVPGLQVQPGVGGPSASPRFLIRGSASLDPYGNQPLVVLDGVILDNQSVLPNTGGADFGNILKDINPDDIESLSVLKGGAVTALYGSRAANGVILIKTKRGYKGRGIGVSFAHSDYVDHAYKTLQYQNQFGSGFSTSNWDTLPNGTLTVDPNVYGVGFGPAIDGQVYLDPSGRVIRNTANNPLMLYRDGLTDNTNVAFNAAGDHSTFRLSYSNLSAHGISPNNELKRNSIQLHLTQELSDKIAIDANTSFVQSGTWNPALQGGSSPLYALSYDVARNYNLPYWASHYIDSAVGGPNNRDVDGIAQGILYPLYEDNQYLIEDNFRGSVQTTVHVLPWMDVQGNVNANIYSRNQTTQNRGTNPYFGNPYYGVSSSLLEQFRYNASLLLKKALTRDLNGSFQGGAEMFTSQGKGNSANTNTSILPDVYRLSNSANPPTITENAPNSSQLNSVFFQGSLQYKNVYFLNFYGRNDWNSTLVYNDGHGTYSYFYPGADAAWVFTDAFPGFPKMFNFGKLRFSFDKSGNGTDPYNANTGGYSTPGPYITSTGQNVNPFGYSSNTLPNQHLVPEEDYKFETGLELKMLHSRLGADITFYTQTSKEQIINFNVPMYSGVSNALLNAGVVRNSGLEVMLTGTPILTKNFTWSSQFNYTHNHNKVVTLPLGAGYLALQGGGGMQTIAVAGGDYGLMAAQNAFARYQATDNSGHPIASPLNGQHVIATDPSGTFPNYIRAVNYGTTPTTQEPVIGTTQPKFLGSWQNSFTYKHFTLSIFLDSRFGGIEYSNTLQYGIQNGALKSSLPYRTAALGGTTYTPLPGSASFYPPTMTTAPRSDGVLLTGVFQPGATSLGQDNKMHNVGGMTFAAAYKQGWAQPIDAADYYTVTYDYFQGIWEAATFKSDWIVVRDISLGYDLPSGWATKMKMNNLRATISVRNPFYLLNSAMDKVNPDNIQGTGSGNAFDAGGIPYIRTYGFAINGAF